MKSPRSLSQSSCCDVSSTVTAQPIADILTNFLSYVSDGERHNKINSSWENWLNETKDVSVAKFLAN